MFGYTVPSYGVMSASDLNVYRLCYCGSCHQLRKNFGIISTAAVNYDMTFNSMILNAVSENGVMERNAKKGMICILGKCACDNDILKKVAAYTLILTKWELEDDKNDHPNIRSNAARIALGRAIRKAANLYPEYDEHVGKGFEELRNMEERGCGDPAAIGKRFASSLMPAMADIAGDAWNNDLKNMFTSLGAMIYVLDAVDDMNEDYMNGTFNPFLTECKNFVNKAEFIHNNVYAVTDTMNSVMKDVQSSYVSVRSMMNFYHGITDNVIYHGIPGTAKRVIGCECSSRPGIRNTITSRILRNENIKR